MNIVRLLLKQADQRPDKAALVFKDQEVSFKQLRDRVLALSGVLNNLGLSQGDKIALYLPNNLECVYSLLAGFSLGVVVVPMDFMLTEEEIINFLNHSQAKLLIISPKPGMDISYIREKCSCVKDLIVLDQFENILGNRIYDIGDISIDEDDLAAIFYTSGSTGHPKGVMLNYRNLDNPVKSIDYFLKIDYSDIFLCGGVPFSHLGGLVYLLLMLNFSTTVILMERFKPQEFLQNIEKHKVTIFCIVPAMYIAILSLKNQKEFDLSSLKYAVVFGAPSSPELLKKFNMLCPKAALSNGWGMTETSAPNSLSDPKSGKIESIGKFSPFSEVQIVDSQGVALKFNQTGELLIRGEAVMKGYYNEPELTEQVLDKQGWFRTGDMACCDEQGYFYIVGRKKDMIKVAGEIVFPAEIEEKLMNYPGIKEAAVVGIFDKLRGEVPKAFLVTEEGCDLDLTNLKEFLRKNIAHFKMPHYIELVKELPKNRLGKIDKVQLKKLISN